MARAVLFDMGGTLIHFVRPGNGSWRELEDRGIRGVYRFLIEQGHPLQTHEDLFVEAMFQRLAEGWAASTGGQISLRAIDWIAAGAAEHRLNLDEQALLAAAYRYALPLREGLSAMPGAALTLAALRDRGYQIGLISNTIWPAELHLEDLAEVGLLPYLDVTLFSGDYGVWKPRPQIFRHALERLGSSPTEAIFIGDSPREDILGAQHVGMRAVWMRSGEFPLGTIRPDAVVDALPEVVRLAEHWLGATGAAH